MLRRRGVGGGGIVLHHQLDLRPRGRFAKDFCDVQLHGAKRKAEPVGDLAAAQALDHEVVDLALARGQRRGRGLNAPGLVVYITWLQLGRCSRPDSKGPGPICSVCKPGAISADTHPP